VKNGSTNLFNVDSTNSIISLGTTDTTGAVLVLDVKSTTGDPTGSSAVVGAMYYNSNLNKFRCYQNTGWADCITTVTTTLQDAYNNDSAGVADITTSSAAKTFLFKAGTGFDSATLFDIQDAGGINMFTVDSVNDRVYIGDSGADTVGAVLVLDTKNTTGHPTGIDGAMYYNSADKSFECYKNGLWADCNFSSLRSEWVFQEDFAGGLTTTGNVGDNGWLLSALGSGTVAYTSVGTAGAQNQDRFGVLQFASTTTNPSGISVRQNAGVMTGVPSNMTVEFDFAPVNAAAAAGLQQITRIGLHNSTNATAPTNGLYFQYVATTTAGNWSYCVQAACLSTGVARTTTANQYQRFRIQTNAAGTSVEFFINEVSVGVVSSGLPGSTAVYTPAYNATDTDATVRQWKTDYFQIKRNLTTLR
jgi:hypothetical protein